MRAVIYSRYSSDRQSDTSIADQIQLCRERIEALGGEVVDTFSDHAISGAKTDRPALLEMMAAAQTGKFDTVVSEALDRISRDQENIAGVFKRLAYYGVSIETVAEGQISELHIGLKGTMNALFLQDLAAKTKRGQMGAVERGRIPGGLSYGYAADHSQLDDKGQPKRGIRTIDLAQADIIRRIFTEYAAGKSPKSIAHELNAEGVASPRGSGWRASAIFGNAKRGNGILHNRLYVGEIAYNRQSFFTDPDTGKRTARPNPPHEWKTQQAPELRIVSDELWQAAHARMASVKRAPGNKRPKRLLSGLIRCGSCGSPYVGRGRGRMACSARVEKGTCSNSVHVAMDAAETRVLDALKTMLLDPELVDLYAREFVAELRTQLAARDARKTELQQSIQAISQTLDQTAEALIASPKLQVLHTKAAELEANKTALEAELNSLPDSQIIPLTPALANSYREKVERLETMIRAGNIESLNAQTAIRSMVDAVVVSAEKDAFGAPALELVGDLAAIMAFANGTPETFRDRMEVMVAGAGFGHFHITVAA